MDPNGLSLEALYESLSGTGLMRRLLELARDEDVGSGDITSAVCLDGSKRASARMVARDGGVVAGLATLPEMVGVFGAAVNVEYAARDGERVAAGTTLATMTGRERDLLTIERTALNLVGRLSGIATRTSEFVAEMRRGGAVRAGLYDTRKTTPGLRSLEKYAVRCGGGLCHRLGLHDAVLIKDNHIAGVPLSGLATYVGDAAKRARAERPGLLFVEAEVDSLEQLQELLRLGPGVLDIILLDNMSTDVMRRAVAMRDGSRGMKGPELEASGGVRLGTIRAIAETGVDRISAGTLTHGAVSLDVALDVIP